MLSPSRSRHFLWGFTLVMSLALWRTGRAEEGMYLPYHLKNAPLTKLKRAGLKVSKKALKGLMPAVVQLARGGTGSFVSSKGLIVTNHHVAFSCLVTLDGDTHKGVMKKGYVAKLMKDELPCRNYEMKVVERLKDVTQEVLKGVRERWSPKKRFAFLRRRMRAMERRCEKKPGRVCEVRPVNGGVAYTLTRYRRIHDVRLVYAPPISLGKYGGDKDNWRYPRHTADFTFLRAYVAPNGAARSYNKKNVPFKPKKFLRVSTKGVRRGDLNVVMGFPGRTMRHSTFFRARHHRRKLMPFKKTLFKELLSVLPSDDLSKRRYQGLDASLNNAMKYYSDVMKQFDRFKVLGRKRRDLEAMRAKIQKDRSLKRNHGKLLGRIEKIYKALSSQYKGLVVVGYLSSSIVRSLRLAVDIVKTSRYRKTPDGEIQEERYRKKNRFRIRKGSELLERVTTLEGERRLLSSMIQAASRLKGEHRPGFVKWFHRWTQRRLAALKKKSRGKEGDYEERFKKKAGVAPTGDPIKDGVALIYGGTRLYGVGKKKIKRALKRRRRLLKASKRRVKRFRDPLLELAKQVVRDGDRYRKGISFKVEKVLGPRLRPPLVRDVIQPRYLDANFTLRVAFGRVRDYRDTESGKKWRYVSRLTWLVRRGKGKWPFVVPKKLRQVYKKKDFGRWKDPVINDVPVNFTSTLDTTGGNSGSPVLNGRGQLVGLLFDGTPESMISDWVYLRKKQRSICVDLRFVLFLGDKVHGAHRVLRELGVKK